MLTLEEIKVFLGLYYGIIDEKSVHLEKVKEIFNKNSEDIYYQQVCKNHPGLESRFRNGKVSETDVTHAQELEINRYILEEALYKITKDKEMPNEIQLWRDHNDETKEDDSMYYDPNEIDKSTDVKILEVPLSNITTNSTHSVMTFYKPGLNIISGRPSCYKTTLMMEILENLNGQGYKTAFASLEMTPAQIKYRFGDVKSKLMAPKFGYTKATLKQTIRKMCYSNDVLAIDYFQILPYTGMTYTELTDWARFISRTAKQTNTCIIMGCQLLRKVDNRNNASTGEIGRPRLSDIMDTDALAQEAEIVYGLVKTQTRVGKEIHEFVLMNMTKNRYNASFDYDVRRRMIND